MTERPYERVSRGIRPLTETRPTWPAHIAIAHLDPHCAGQGILIQLFGSVEGGLDHLGIPRDQAYEHGFGPDDPGASVHWFTVLGLYQGDPLLVMAQLGPIPPTE